MAYAKNATVSLQSILTTVKEQLGLENTTKRDFFLKKRIKQGAKEIWSMDMMIQKIETLEICNLSAKLPCDFIMFNKVGGIVFTVNGVLDTNNILGPIYDGAAFFKCNPDPNTNCCYTGVQVVGEYLYFTPEGDSVPTEVTISYLAVRMDCDGNIFVPESHERTIEAFACAEYMLKNTANFSPVQITTHLMRWRNGKRMLAGDSKVPDALQWQQVARIWNSFF